MAVAISFSSISALAATRGSFGAVDVMSVELVSVTEASNCRQYFDLFSVKMQAVMLAAAILFIDLPFKMLHA